MYVRPTLACTHTHTQTKIRPLNHSYTFQSSVLPVCVPSISLFFFDNSIFIDYSMSFSYDFIIDGLFIHVSKDGAHNRHVHRH